MNDVTLNDTAIEAFRDSARDLLGRGNTIARLRKLRSSDTGFDRSAWQEIANAGWLGVLVPEHEGGLGLGLREMSALAEEIGQQLPEPLIAVAVQLAWVLSGGRSGGCVHPLCRDGEARRNLAPERVVAQDLGNRHLSANLYIVGRISPRTWRDGSND